MSLMKGIPIPERSDRLELMDDPNPDRSDLAANLRDIRLMNRWLGGTAFALHHVRRLLAGHTQASLLDVATGSADIPLALRRWAARRGAMLEVTGLDASDAILREADKPAEAAGLHLVQGDARCLPWRDESYDVVMCCLAIHHFGPGDVETVLSEMWRTCRIGTVVIDLARSYEAYAATWLLTKAPIFNGMTQNDGPLSVLRAYTPEELGTLAQRSGLRHIRQRRHYPFRQALVATKAEAGD